MKRYEKSNNNLIMRGFKRCLLGAQNSAKFKLKILLCGCSHRKKTKKNFCLVHVSCFLCGKKLFNIINKSKINVLTTSETDAKKLKIRRKIFIFHSLKNTSKFSYYFCMLFVVKCSYEDERFFRSPVLL